MKKKTKIDKEIEELKKELDKSIEDFIKGKSPQALFTRKVLGEKGFQKEIRKLKKYRNSAKIKNGLKNLKVGKN